MRKIKLLLAAVLSTMTWTGMMAQDTSSAEYQDALNAIVDGSNYRIKTTVSGTDYYVTTSGTLTSAKDDAGIFTITKTDGGYFGKGFRIYTGTEVFTNPPLNGNQANLKPGSYARSSNNDREGWERQILYLNSDGKYAIRSCNCQDGTSSWNDAARTHWTYYMVGDVVTPCYSYTPDYIWDFEIPPVIVNVTYKLMEGGTEVSSTTVKQEANSAVNVPKTLTSASHNGLWHEIFYYDYAVSGTIGDTDCTITITRTVKAGTVHALADLSNNKAYNIGCKRGAFLSASSYMISTDLNATANAAGPGQFAVISYESNYYLYSVADGKFVTNTGALADNWLTEGHGTGDAIKIEAKTDPYFLFYFTIDGTNNGLNTNGNQPLGYVINTWMNADDGNQYFMVEAADFDPTAALETLNNYFHPAYKVIYVVKDELGNVIFNSGEQPTTGGAHITTLPADFQRTFYTYSETDVEITELVTTVEFTATWAGPFKLSTDFANAQWQNMAMRTNWYVTNAITDGDGAYKTQKANTLGLVEDSYQWAFLGNGYDGFMIINKAAGDGYSFGWTDANETNAGIPTVMSNSEGNHTWKVVASTNTSVPAGSFCLNVAGTNLYINQYGGVQTVNGVEVGGSLKFWNSANNIGDPGSAFTVFDVPCNFASFVVDEIAPYMDATGYFSLTDAAKASIGYDESKKTDCSFADYKNMKEKLTAEFLADASNYILPETGYYILKNKYYGTYMGIDPSDANMYGNYKTANLAKNVVALTKTGAATYTIGLMGKFAPATVEQSQSVTATADAGTYTVVIPAIGYAAFQADPSANMSCLHTRATGDIVGWEATADASQWAAADAESIQLTIGAEGYATAYLPFPVEFKGLVPVPEAKGVWTFDDPDNLLAGTGVATLQATTHQKNNVTVTTPAAANIIAVDGPAAGNGAVEVPVGSSLLMAANTGATSIGTYTIMWDVCADDCSTYIPLLQNSLTDGKDGSFYINNFAVGHGGDVGYNGSIQNGEWNRIVLVVEPYGASVYLNGEFLSSKYGLTASNQAYYMHWLLSTGALFFADEDGEENVIKASEIRFWDEALSASQVKQLGTISGAAVAQVTIPEAKGAWTFDDATTPMAGTGVSTMTASSGVVVNGDGSVTVPVGDQLEMTTNLAETSLNTYTLMMDVKFPDVSSYTALFQNKLANNGDASLFIKNGQIGINYCGVGYNGSIAANTWYRVVFVVNDLNAFLYVDGEKVGQSTAQGAQHWQLSTGVLFFRDDDVDEKVVTTTGICFWDEALTPAQVAKMATVGTDFGSSATTENYDVTAYTATITNNENNNSKFLTLSKLDGTIPTKTAVVLKGAPETYVYNVVAEAAPITTNALKGTLENLTTDGTQYILAKDEGKIGFYKASGSIKPGKAYLEYNPADVKAFYFMFDDNATAIKAIDNGQQTTVNSQNGVIFNLAGQRISKMQKGINIVNGKKILR